MSSGALRLLLVEGDPREAERISSALVNASHTVLPATNFQEASEALDIQRFDAVVLGRALHAQEMGEFTSKLRALEHSQRACAQMPVLPLPEPFEPGLLANAIGNLLRAVGGNTQATSSGCPDLPVLEPEGFLDQVAYDRVLMVEIIDLFFAERERQIPDMENALAAAEYDRLQRVAHTIKGSLGSLHAT